jgi:hypothetical protein
MPDQRQDLLRAAEAWWALIARVIAFLFGGALIYQQATMPNPPGAQESLIAVGVGLMGPFAASLFASGVERARGKDPE